MSQINTLTRGDRIDAAMDKRVVGDIQLSSKTGMTITSMSEAMEFSKLMSLSKQAVPPHLRENVGACMAICIQGFEWSMNPFALANKSYVVNDRLAYEAALYHAVIARRAPIRGRIKMEYAGDGPTRTCRVWADLADDTGIVDYTSPKFAAINPKNSPLWKNDPDQQLFYFSVRGFARRHFPDVMMGIFTVDEMMDTEPVRTTVAPSGSKTERLLQKVTSRPLSEGQTLEPADDAGLPQDDTDHRPEPRQEPPAPAQQASPAADPPKAVPEAPAPSQDVPKPSPEESKPEQTIEKDAVDPLAGIVDPTHILSDAKLLECMGAIAQAAGIPEKVMMEWLGTAVAGDRKNITGKRRLEVYKAWKKEVAGMLAS